jgi:hypothetical protein
MLIVKCRYNHTIILIPINSIKRLYLYLKRLISLLRRFYCRAKRVADLAAPWLAQLALTNAALTAANEAMNNARFEMETDAELSSKSSSLREQCLILIIKCSCYRPISRIPLNQFKCLYR